ncbi:MAG: hypothetical protein BGO21_24620 [Dyadobacter sp. 50-39]|nr:MAG: hypothetical protein BGO21_24620 [Dyadobacter sp. 50-39]
MHFLIDQFLQFSTALPTLNSCQKLKSALARMMQPIMSVSETSPKKADKNDCFQQQHERAFKLID